MAITKHPGPDSFFLLGLKRSEAVIIDLGVIPVLGAGQGMVIQNRVVWIEGGQDDLDGVARSKSLLVVLEFAENLHQIDHVFADDGEGLLQIRVKRDEIIDSLWLHRFVVDQDFSGLFQVFAKLFGQGAPRIVDPVSEELRMLEGAVIFLQFVKRVLGGVDLVGMKPLEVGNAGLEGLEIEEIKGLLWVVEPFHEFSDGGDIDMRGIGKDAFDLDLLFGVESCLMGKKIREGVNPLFGQLFFLLIVGPDQGRNVVGSEIVETGFLERAIAASGVEMMDRCCLFLSAGKSGVDLLFDFFFVESALSGDIVEGNELIGVDFSVAAEILIWVAEVNLAHLIAGFKQEMVLKGYISKVVLIEGSTFLVNVLRFGFDFIERYLLAFDLHDVRPGEEFLGAETGLGKKGGSRLKSLDGVSQPFLIVLGVRDFLKAGETGAAFDHFLEFPSLEGGEIVGARKCLGMVKLLIEKGRAGIKVSKKVLG